MPSELKQKAVKGLGWLGVGQVVDQVLSLCITGILARLLLPRAFGLVGMVVVFTAFLERFKGLGLGLALIQRRDVTEEQLTTVFTIHVAVGLILAGLTAAAGPLIAEFYDEPILATVAIFIGMRFFVTSFQGVFASLLRKRLHFRRLVVTRIVSKVVGGAVGITMALLDFGVYALVAEGLTYEIVFGASLWLLGDWRPRARPRPGSIRGMFRFGANVTGASLLHYFSRYADYLLIGRFLGPGPLGVYTIAYRIMLLPLRRVSRQISQVVFPAFSAVQNDLPRVRRGFLEMSQMVAAITFPAMAGLVIVAPDAVPLILGEKWLRAVFLIQVLALTGALQSITGPVTHILRAQGRAGLHFGYKLCETPLTVLAFVIGLRWSVEGVAVAYTGLQMLVNPVLLFLLARVIGLRFGRLYRALRGPVGATIAMAAAVFLYRYGAVRVGLGATWLLCSEIGVGVVVYAAAIRFGSPGLYRLGSETAKILLTPLVPSLEASRETAEVGASE